MPVMEVSDKISNLSDQIANAARILGRSKHRIKVFQCIYHGKKRCKTKSEISRITGLNNIQVLKVGGRLAANYLVEQTKVKGETSYKKISFYSQHKNTILRLAKSTEKLSQYPTKVTPKGNVTIKVVKFKFPKKPFDVSQIAVDDIDSFRKVKSIRGVGKHKPMNEALFKEGIKNILGEASRFKDWGGEKNDLFTTRVQIKKKRIPTAFAFKGKGAKGVLKPSMMGKNGDQIQRLFETPAELYVVQYWGEIDPSIYEQMNSFAIKKSATEHKKIIYCVIDGTDTSRILKAYPMAFRGSKRI